MKESIIRSRAPLRISFGGGGTELSPYLEEYGGVTLSTTITSHAYCTITISEGTGIEIHSDWPRAKMSFSDIGKIKEEMQFIDSSLKIAAACGAFFEKELETLVHKRVEIKTSCDAQLGSGLGASSTLTVACLNAFQSLFRKRMTRYQIASTAFFIERKVLNLSGGRQDHYASAFGGMNYVQYFKDGQVSVERIDLSDSISLELQSSLLMVYTGTSRASADIIDSQQMAMFSNNDTIISNLHFVKKLASDMRFALLDGDIQRFGSLLGESWDFKKATSAKISNSNIDFLYSRAKELGAYGGKISGAGGGGFLLLVVPPEKRISIYQSLSMSEPSWLNPSFSQKGVTNWSV